MSVLSAQQCQCPCGATQFTVSGTPLVRAICHCTICQSFNASPYADITVFSNGQVDLPSDHPVEFREYRKPPAVQRGKCSVCDKPAIEYLRLPVLPDIVFVPSANFVDQSILPAPSLHIFYASRVADIQNDLPRYKGYWPSQAGFMRHLLKAVLKRRMPA